ncbi:enoyl-CoA hydratase [Paracoccus sediminicola]|uniref:enoyl-CoA hydratase n=1 Tax=Paracoccus sediminicola TaxID=3017783 RepID=UPI0022F0B817|nr:enoyl-CoA hydratase [Paracoccus sediminicola]WBU57404.1 enoyl-CoA hydratase [Paracoccus sediminicola]
MAEAKGDVTLRIEDAVAHVTFDRPEARNAMSFAMYDRLAGICDRLEAQRDLRAIVFRGAGGGFVAGTDISEFTAFEDGADGVAYEDRIDATLSRLSRLPAPTLAVIGGAAVGGGLAIAAACDLRIVTPEAKFGVPIARTVGNCLSAANIARLVRAFGDGPVRQMLLLSRFLDGVTVHRLGFSSACVPPEELEAEAERQIARLCEAAPITLAACREILGRIEAGPPQDRDIIERVYGSRDFREGVGAFLAKRRPEWQGR